MQNVEIYTTQKVRRGRTGVPPTENWPWVSEDDDNESHETEEDGYSCQSYQCCPGVVQPPHVRLAQLVDAVGFTVEWFPDGDNLQWRISTNSVLQFLLNIFWENSDETIVEKKFKPTFKKKLFHPPKFLGLAIKQDKILGIQQDDLHILFCIVDEVEWFNCILQDKVYIRAVNEKKREIS